MRIVNQNAVPALTSSSGTELRVLLDTRDGGEGRMSLAMETLRPGQHTVPHWHRFLEEIYYIIQGKGRIEIGSEAAEVHAGDAILIPVNTLHCLYNTGDENLVLLCPVSPPWTAEDYHVGKPHQAESTER